MKQTLKTFPFLRTFAYGFAICAPVWAGYLPAFADSLAAEHGFAAWGAAAWTVACINAHTLSDIRRAQRKD